jgi:SNF2 family DNA or RNA helicase
MLPAEWLNKYGAVTAAGEVEGRKIRFKRNQAMLIDALLAGLPEATCDETFSTIRKELCNFDAIRAAEASPDFTGTLRPYQKDGLGWLLFLRQFSFGGCLADDMGLGKTIQVLALLDCRRKNSPPDALRASLVVAPRSVIFNWKLEAAKFTPNLKVLDHTGPDRSLDAEIIAANDIVLTTYGTLRSDINILKDHVFDCIILDESQAIKNAGTTTAKAVRLLRGNNRLAMSGTPIENHLGELWSLMEFLNPGMLGSASVFKLHAGGKTVDSETGKLLSSAMRPFILRRTKSQVAKDLPERTEETIWCELQGSQKKLYNELLAHYRASLMQKVRSDGINKSRMNILEALLRLRQAACHPGLLDTTRTTTDQGAKLEALIPQIKEVLDENHKALIFSQFTSFLSILKHHLDKQKISYEYLDGQTKDRQAGVERFQNDPDCKLFLISLKAGGLGLNLTAAEYVYLLDPWWNPAVEAQAIDRAHRIGQTRKVFAYRLIARDTIEEKVLQLQKSKRDLADAIISEDNSLIGSLTREDLELLLS